MIRRTFTLPLIGLILFTACQTGTKSESSEIRVIPIAEQISNSQDIFLSDFAKDISYIPLETNTDCLLDRDLSLRSYKDGLVLLNKGKQFMIFDWDGKFIRSINKNGKGPGEYLSARQHSVNWETGQLNITDVFGKSILEYTIDGQFIQEIIFPFPANYIMSEPTGGYLMGGYKQQELNGQLYSFVHLDEQGKILYRHFEGPVFEPSSGIQLRSFQFYTHHDRIMGQYAFGDTIHSFVNGAWKPELYLDLGKYDMPKGWQDDLDNYDANRKQFVEHVEINPEDDFTMVYFRLKGKRYYGQYKHKSKELRFAANIHEEMHGFVNDFDGGPAVKPSFYEDQNHWYFIFQAIELISWNEEGFFDGKNIKHTSKYQAFKKMVNKLDENDNPVIMVVEKK